MAFLTLCFLALLYSTSFTTIFGTPPTLCIQWYQFDCIGGDRALLSTGLWLSYTSNSTALTGADEQTYSCRVWVDYNSPLPELQYYEGSDSRNVTSVSYEFEQPEHGGGSCHCFNVTDCNNSSFSKSRCGGSPQEARRMNINWSPPTSIQEESTPELMKELPISTNCSGEQSIIKISYTVYASQVNCGLGSAGANDILEFSIRFLSNPSEWIPLSYTFFDQSSGTVCRRGYCVENRATIFTSSLFQTNPLAFHTRRNIQICRFSLTDSIQIRWLMASFNSVINRTDEEDRWSIDDIEVNLITETDTHTLMVDNFNPPSLNSQYWSMENIRNGNLSTNCSLGSNNQALSFGEGINNLPSIGYFGSPSAITNIINLSGSPPSFQPIYPPVASTLTCNASYIFHDLPTVTSSSDIESTSSQIIQTTTALPDDNQDVSRLETRILSVHQDTISFVLNSSDVDEQLSRLRTIPVNTTDDSLAVVYALGVIFNDAASVDCERDTVQESVNIGSSVIQQSQTLNATMKGSFSAVLLGCTLLQSLERLGIPCEEEVPYSIVEIAGVQIIFVNINESTITIDTSTFTGWTAPYVEASLPLEDLRVFFTESKLKIIVTVYRNICNILPMGRDSSIVVSDVLGISLKCGFKKCPTSNISLSRPLRITFNHNTELKKILEKNQSITTCAFLEVMSTTSSVFRTGIWSTRGCTKRTALSSISRTVCECDHLTHFALLLSPRPPEFSPPIVLSLTVVGIIGTIVSVAAMAATVVVFFTMSFNKKNSPLLNIRYYVHINLCTTLSIAQIIFIAGVDKTGPSSSDNVPIHCQVIAILLHYFFLVSFMWMLMEGVVLYVALVRVFVTRTKSYISFFTALSYGVPLLYLCLFTVPLGVINGGYGYKKACLLESSNNFVWTLTAPVIAIFLLNIGFFIRTAAISWKQHKKRVNEKNNKLFLDWLKSVIPLVVILGLTWIFGIFVVELDVLAPLAYLYTIVVAFQGVFIFAVLVVFSKKVRDDYVNWWKIKLFKKKKSPYAASNNKQKFPMSGVTPAKYNKEKKSQGDQAAQICSRNEIYKNHNTSDFGLKD